MDLSTVTSAHLWTLASRQAWTIARRQLLAAGLSPHAIAHRLGTGRLHPTRWRGVYAVGRPALTPEGRWWAALLACGEGSLLVGRSGAALYGVEREGAVIEIAVARGRRPRRPGVQVHGRRLGDGDSTTHRGVPCLTIDRTLADLALVLSTERLERAVNAADRLGLVSAAALRARAGALGSAPGARALRRLLDRDTFRLTESVLEQRFLALARRAGLPAPATQVALEAGRVDFSWSELGLVVETDGLRYHRTPAAQAADLRRDQLHTAAGRTPLRFSHAQVRDEPDRVMATLAATAARLRAR